MSTEKTNQDAQTGPSIPAGNHHFYTGPCEGFFFKEAITAEETLLIHKIAEHMHRGTLPIQDIASGLRDYAKNINSKILKTAGDQHRELEAIKAELIVWKGRSDNALSTVKELEKAYAEMETLYKNQSIFADKWRDYCKEKEALLSEADEQENILRARIALLENQIRMQINGLNLKHDALVKASEGMREAQKEVQSIVDYINMHLMPPDGPQFVWKTIGGWWVVSDKKMPKDVIFCVDIAKGTETVVAKYANGTPKIVYPYSMGPDGKITEFQRMAEATERGENPHRNVATGHEPFREEGKNEIREMVLGGSLAGKEAAQKEDILKRLEQHKETIAIQVGLIYRMQEQIFQLQKEKWNKTPGPADFEKELKAWKRAYEDMSNVADQRYREMSAAWSRENLLCITLRCAENDRDLYSRIRESQGAMIGELRKRLELLEKTNAERDELITKMIQTHPNYQQKDK